MRVTLKCRCDKHLDRITPCCEFFKQMLNDCRVRLVYLERRDMYCIRFIASSGKQGILYCPWCGTKFPDPLPDDDD